jgi:hypothetical protein
MREKKKDKPFDLQAESGFLTVIEGLKKSVKLIFY